MTVPTSTLLEAAKIFDNFIIDKRLSDQAAIEILTHLLQEYHQYGDRL